VTKIIGSTAKEEEEEENEKDHLTSLTMLTSEDNVQNFRIPYLQKGEKESWMGK